MRASLLCSLLLSHLLLVAATGNHNSSPCSPFTTTIYGGQKIDTAGLSVVATDSQLKFTFTMRNGWQIQEVHIYAGTSAPSSHSPGQFPFKFGPFNPDKTGTFTLTIPFQPGWSCGTGLQIAVHTDTINPGTGHSCSAQETGWAYGSHSFKRAWGWWFDYKICCQPPAPSSCTGPDGTVIPSGSSKKYYETSTSACGCECKSQWRTCTNGQLSGTYTKPSCTEGSCSSCTGPDGSTIPHGGSKTYYQYSTVPCGNNCNSQVRRCTDGELSGSYTKPTCSAVDCPCTGPDGTVIPHGQSKTYYKSCYVPCGSTCRSQERTCDNKVLSGYYTNPTCSVTGCSSCTGPDGSTIPHGQSKTYYLSTSVGCGSTCSSQTRTCNDGDLSGSGSYCKPTCSVTPCPCTGPDGSMIPHGSSKTYYQSTSVACGSTCNSQTRTCTDGVLSGSFIKPSCSVTPCPCTGPDGSSIPHGSSKVYYQSSSVACGSTCNSQTRTCTDGVLSGSYTKPSCTVGTCPSTACVGPDGTSIPRGSSKVYYQSSTVPCGSNCVSQVRECRSNGQLTGSYTKPSCTRTPCPCTGPDGTSIPHGGNKVYYQSSTVGCGQTCSSQTRTCTDGALSGSYIKPSCTASACANCVGPDGSMIPHGESKTYFTSSSVACGQTCSAQTRTCTDGVLSGSNTMPSCSVALCPCTGPDGSMIPSGTTKTYYFASSVACGDECLSQGRTCTDGVLSGSYTALTCAATPCDCTLPDGTTIPSGSNAVLYSSSSVPCGTTCSAETRNCVDGVLSGSNTAMSCSAQPCGCVMSDGTLVPSGTTITLWQSSTVGCGQTCSSQSRECVNGVLSGDSSYNARSCSVSTCSGCVGPDGSTIPHGGSKTYYTTSSVECGTTCTPQTRNCYDGVLSGGASNPTCYVLGCPPPPPPIHTDCVSKKGFFGLVPSLFNVFLFEDFTCTGSDTEGRLAAGGNVVIDSYGLGCKVYPSDGNCITFGAIKCDDVSLWGDWMSTLVGDGDVVVTHAQVYVGNIAYGNSYNNDVTASFQSDCTLQHAHVIDFAYWKTYLTTLSHKLESLTATGSAVWQWNKLTLTGTGSSLEVFNVQGSVLCTPNGSPNPTTVFEITGVAADATVIVNVDGTANTCQGLYMTGYAPNHVLFNFHESTSLTFGNVEWKGSVLAVNADMREANNGLFNGQVIANSWISLNGNCMQQNWNPFEGCLPTTCASTTGDVKFCTPSQSGYDAVCMGDEMTLAHPECNLEGGFDDCFGAQGITIGCDAADGQFLVFNSSRAVQDFLPQTSVSTVLASSELGPIGDYGRASGELLTLGLTLGFDTCNNVGTTCDTIGSVKACSGSCAPFSGMTISAIYDVANRVVGGCSSAFSLSDVEACLIQINGAFSGCQQVDASFGTC